MHKKFAFTATQNTLSRTVRLALFNSTNARIAASNSAAQNISYYDAWGRVKQQVENGASTDRKDVITHFEYDHMGRQSKTYLPYIDIAYGTFRTNAAAAQASYYASLFPGETHPYSEKIYENSALDRVLEAYNVGKVFRTNNKKQTFGYDVESNTVRKLTYDPEWSGFKVSGTYDKVMVSTSTNEDGQTVRTYTDGWGRTVASRSDLENGAAAWTLYVYDGKGRLMWVVSPEGAAKLTEGSTVRSEDDIAKKYCYMYTYSDFRNRMIGKRLPGAEPVWMVYDLNDRVIGVQDGNQRTRNEWTLTSYDNMGRIIEQWSVVKSGVDNRLTTHTFSSLMSGSTSQTKLLACSYDTYPAAALAYENVYQINAMSQTYGYLKGQKTYEWVKLIGDGAAVQAIERTFYYDKEGHLIQTVEKNHRGGISRYSSRIDFRGNVLEAKESHAEPGRTEDMLKTINTFDHRGRLLQSRVKLNNSDEMVVKETYNPLGQVVKWQFGPGAEQGLNFLPITYNIQGWVTSYGNTNFRYKLKYFDPTIAEPSYTGNVTQAIFAHAMAADQNIGYTYDKLNRLKTANFYRYPDDITPNRETQYEETDFVYDLNGNITSLKRANQPISITYDGNKLAQYNKAGYFEYDANGNTLTTKNTGKDLQFEFNSLNLLDNVKQNGAVKARYIWTADGAKRAVADAARSNGFEYLGSLVYARMNGVLELESANLADGRILKTSNSYYVQYYYKDHLGSVRFVDRQYGRDDYMPYGSRMQADGYATSTSRTKFTGKELQTLSVTASNGALTQLGLYDFGARMYDPVTARWLTQDPLAEKYYSMSPYLYCAGNPIRYVDPNGMEIDEASQAEWKRRQEEIKRQRERLQKSLNKQLEKDPRSNRVATLQERIGSVGSTLKTMNVLENSSQMYSLKSSNTSAGQLKLKGTTIEIEYNGTSNFVHEVTHAGQFERGEIGFFKETGESFAQDVFDEVAAFKAQYNYELGSIAPIAQGVNNIHDITSAWVQSITVGGKQAYVPGGKFNTGLTSVSVHSPVSDFRKAYPNAMRELQGFPAHHKLTNIYQSHYKK